MPQQPYNNQIARLQAILESQEMSPEKIEYILAEMTKEFIESHKDMPVGINPLIFNENGEILLLRRANSFGAGTYCLPDGHLKTDETIEEGLIRECQEELGIKVRPEDIQIINLAETLTTKHHIQIGALIKKHQGTPSLMEPQKADELSYHALNNLPELFIGTKPNITLYQQNKFYDKTCNYKQ